ncbi:hypothetical protein PENTCL1PPCAC_14090, partial [Pristionchus entomophagus]
MHYGLNIRTRGAYPSPQIAALSAVLPHPDRIALDVANARESPVTAIDVCVETRRWFAVHLIDEIDVCIAQFVSLSEKREVRRVQQRNHRRILQVNGVCVRVVVHDRIVRVLDAVTRVERLVGSCELVVLLGIDIRPIDLDELVSIDSEVLMDDSQGVEWSISCMAIPLFFPLWNERYTVFTGETRPTYERPQQRWGAGYWTKEGLSIFTKLMWYPFGDEGSDRKRMQDTREISASASLMSVPAVSSMDASNVYGMGVDKSHFSAKFCSTKTPDLFVFGPPDVSSELLMAESPWACGRVSSKVEAEFVGSTASS